MPINLNHSFSAEQKLFFDRIEQFATKNNVTENIIDRAFSERPVYRRTYRNRDKLSQNMFNHSLKVLESELERVIRKNLAESNEKSAVSVEQESSETTNVHSEKTEGQEMAKYNIVVDIPKYNLTLDFSEINSVSLKEEQQNYIGGLDSDGHEAKDNYDIKPITTRYYVYDNDLYVHEENYGTMLTTIEVMTTDIEEFLDKSLESTDYRLEIEDKNGNTTIFDASKNIVAVNDDVSEETPEEVLQVNEFENRASLKTRLIKEKTDRCGSSKESFRRRAFALQGRFTQQMSCIAVFSQKGFLEMPNKQSEIIQDNTTKTDFTITDDKLGEGGAKTKFRANVEAIKTLKAIEANGRTATPEEQEILSKYVGWDGLKNAFEDFHDDWKKKFTELKELLTPEEYKLAKASVLSWRMHTRCYKHT